MIKAAIFDMDGLLIDSEPLWRRSHVEINAKHGFTITEDDVRAMAGKRTDEVVAHWITRHGWEDADDEKLVRETIDKVIAQVNENAVPMPGVYEALELFKSHKIPIAIASSSTPDLIAAVIDKLKLEPYIQLAYSGANEKFGKPDPAVFITTARKLAVPPAGCLVFEDSLNGVIAAKAAGMKCIAVPEPVNRKKPEFKKADMVVNSLSDVTWQTIEALFG